MLARFLLQGLLIYFAYRFIFNFLVPVIRTTRQLRNQAKNFQQKVKQNAPQPEEPASRSSKKTKPADKGDYIDFEEV